MTPKPKKPRTWKAWAEVHLGKYVFISGRSKPLGSIQVRVTEIVKKRKAKR